MKSRYLLISVSSFHCNETDGRSRDGTCGSETEDGVLLTFNSRPTSVLKKKAFNKFIVRLDTNPNLRSVPVCLILNSALSCSVSLCAERSPLISRCFQGSKFYPTFVAMKTKLHGTRLFFYLVLLKEKYKSDTRRVQ